MKTIYIFVDCFYCYILPMYCLRICLRVRIHNWHQILPHYSMNDARFVAKF